MIPFQTTKAQFRELTRIIPEMATAELVQAFIVGVFNLASTDQGVHDLVVLWHEAKDDPEERKQIVADLQDALDDAETTGPPLKHVRFKDLGDVARQVVAFKAKLRSHIDHGGGISHVARLTGIPQPSLSRMLTSASIPRRTTLHKIAKALNLRDEQIATEWVR